MEKFEITNPQKSIWVTEEFYKGTSIEIIAGTTTIEGTVNFDKLKQAINLFVKNTASFRLKFVNENNKILQYISDYEELNFELVDVESEKDVKRLEKEFSSTPFKIFDSLMFKFKLFKFKDGHGGFIVAGHHMLVDAWACGLVISNVLKIYDSLVHGIEFNEELYSYIDYIKSEQEYLSSNKYLKDKEFWDEQFKFIPESATIPGTLQSNEISSSARRKLFKIPAETMELINAYCKSNKISPFNFFMGAYSLYISRVTSLDEFVIGTPVLNRSNIKEKHTIGMFVSVVPFKVNINWDLTFENFTKQISSDFFKIFKHQKYPYQTLLEDIRKENSNIPNLFNIMLSYQNMRTETKTTGTKYKTDWLFNGNISDDIDIHFFDINDSGTINVAYDYRTSKYTADDIYALHSRMLNIINQILENNNITLKDIEIVTPDERDEILYKFNDTKMDYPKDKTIVQLFEEQVQKTPNNIAVVFEDQKLTYKELNEKANSLAHFLKSKKVKPNDVIAIYLEKSIEIVVSMFGILKANCTFLPIDINYPQDRVTYMILNSKAKFICSTLDLYDNLSVFSENLINVSLNNNNIYSLDTNNLKHFSPNNNIYIIYTSGSTGKPKGVIVTHQNIVRLVTNQNFIKYSSFETMVQTGTIAFDACIFEIFTPLLHGFKLYILKKDTLLDIDSFARFLKDKQISILFLTTGLFNQFGSVNPKMFNTIKYLLTGGDVISTQAVNNILKANSNIQVINCYGPTENGSYSTCFPVPHNWKKEYIPIGKPIANSTAYIVSKNGNLLPYGCIGELWVGGDGISKGYVGLNELTKEKFVKSPFSNEILYKTGDLTRYDAFGNICFLGRIDSQVKIRGFRIELSEISNTINKFPGITESISIIKDLNRSKKILSYFIAKETINIPSLKEFISKNLPNYMIPFSITQLEKFPLTSNGKIDIKNLPTVKEDNKNIVLPRNDIDDRLIKILKELLGLDSISINDNFLEIGGDSLSAINLCSQIQSEFSSTIYVKDILENPNIKDISDIISSSIKDKKQIIIKRIPKADFYPVSSAQKRIYFASKMAGNSILYNIPGGVILTGKIDFKKLEDSFKALIKRHESLRTYFELENNVVVQKIAKNVDFELEYEINNSTENLDLLFKNFVKPFVLTKVPLFRAKLVNFGKNQSALFIDMHHIISDGTSLSILTDELCKLYNNEQLPELEITYKDFASFENNKLLSGDMKDSEEYWLNQFEGEIPVLNLPTQFSRPAVQSFEGKKIYSFINSELMEQINTVSKELGVTPYMVLLSVYYILLSKYTSQDDIVIGTPVVGRDMVQTNNLIGMFVNTLALREKIDDRLKFSEFLNHIKNSLLTSYKYQTYPFDELVNKLDVKRDPSRNPLFDTMFIYQNTSFNEMNFNSINTKIYVPDTGISKFDLSLEIIPNKEGAKISFEYATKLFSESFISSMSIHYLNILKSVLVNTEIIISEIDILSEEERNKILYEFNNTKMDYPKSKTITQLFEEQVQKAPDNIAVVFENQKLTYKELNEKANSLAHYLRNTEIGRNDLVGIMVNRSLEMIISIIAVLKAGGAYIPIDPSYPKDRIEYMLNSSNAKVLLTQKALENKVHFNNKIFIDLNNTSIYSWATNNLESINMPEDLAYIIFTSGSTGLPKGVMLIHKSLSNLTAYCNNYVEYLKNSSCKTIVSITTMSFDIFIFETLISLQKGLQIIIANQNEQTVPKLLNDLIEEYNVEIIQATPSRMQFFVNNISDFSAIKKLKYIILAGEQLPLSLVNTLHQLSGATVYNGYGPSETTVFSTLTEMDDSIVTIGKPLSNTDIYILDKNLNPLPIGISGEIYISGDGLGNGYLNNAQLNQKSFINNPFISNSLMYKTGDIGTFLDDGRILCLGRIDNQVKIRGVRIELGEIEAQIQKYPHINKVTVIKQTIGDREFISAYYVSDQRISISELRKNLSKTLPKHMIPSYFTALEDFPYTPNGKVDKKALPLPSEILGTNKEEYIAPKTKLQKQLVSIWENILNIKPIGINDNFFELGGDSILAMNLNIELLKISNKLNYSDIFRFPTIAELEQKINSDDNKPIFSKIENLSANFTNILNNSTKKEKLSDYSPSGIILTGATGFLGIHVLEEIIKHEDCNIYCIIREEPGLTSRAKLYQKMNYYFGNKYDYLIDNKIFAITGNISEPGFGLNHEDILSLANSVDMVINCAARVAHFGNYNDFYNSNVKSVKYIIDFCNSFNKKLYHISTLSISGSNLDLSLPANKRKQKVFFNESCLYVGQILDNVYTRSKFEAESYILDAISKGLDGYILRMGNLMPRLSDGVFQENILDNAFINKLTSFIRIGFLPEYMISQPLEFTPIDCAAESIFRIIKYPTKNNRIFHLFNNNYVTVKKYLKVLKKLGYNIVILPEEDFKNKINTILKDDNSKYLLNNLLNEFNNNLHFDYKSDIIIKSDFTKAYLRKTHFKWPKITNKYLIRFINILRKVI